MRGERLLSESRMIRNRARALILLAGAAAFVGVAVMVAIAATADGEALTGAVAALIFVCAAGWCSLTASSGVLVGENGVVLRAYGRDRYVPWDEVVAFGLQPHRSKLGQHLEMPSLTLRSGEVVRLLGVEPPGRPLGISSKPIEFKQLDELERLARRHRSRRWRLGNDLGED